MACNNKKDLNKAIAISKIRFVPDFKRKTFLDWSGGDYNEKRKHSRFIVVYLWESLEEMRTNACGDGGYDALACCAFMEPFGDFVAPKLGEMHFAIGSWNIGLIAHECAHMIEHFKRYIGPSATEIAKHVSCKRFNSGSAEEDICCVMENMAQSVFEVLSKSDKVSA